MAKLDEALTAYAALLTEAGFTVTVPTGDWNFFRYSRIVDGVECSGTVHQCTYRLEGYSHSMPIRPSRENGSSMWIPEVEDGWDNLTVEAAELIARPYNSNDVVGSHANYRHPRDADRYVGWPEN